MYFLNLKNSINILSAVVLILAVYLMTAPYLPKLTYQITRPSINSYTHNILFRGPEDTKTNPQVLSNYTVVPFVSSQATVAEKNRLTIPSIGVDGEVKEGDNSKFLKKGIWHLPYTGTPAEGGNTVLIAHRYLETSGPETFYHLDKLKPGDTFTLDWEGLRYTYEVFESKVVLPTAIEVEQPTAKPTLTLYTCTPLWSTTHRLVVVAYPISVE